MKKLFFVLLLICKLSISFGQSKAGSICKEKHFQVSIGINQIKENNLHPKVHTGIGYELNYGFTRINKNLSSFQTNFLYSKVKTVFENHPSSINLHFKLNYEYSFLIQKTNNYTFYSGIATGLNYAISHYPNWDDSHLYWANFIDLKFSNRLYYQLSNDDSFIVCLQLPILFLVIRPEVDRQYKIDDLSFEGLITNFHANPQLGTWNKNRAIQSSLEYKPKSKAKFKTGFLYQFSYTKLDTSKSNSFSTIQHLLGLKLYL
ncbi:hypothetical protein ACE193_07750 [Bernardetia sp. OM2101]|uniref:hypothetical protein n=1 Tax=Bernardetia sp. OM2101 TaxID=3344876 RepID=UPI0035CF7AED